MILQVGHHFLQPSLLVGRQATVAQDFRHTFGSKDTRGGKVSGFGQGRFHVGTLDNARLAIHGLDDIFRKFVARVGHGESSRTGPRLGLDDFVAAKLRPDREGFQFLVRRAKARDFGKEGQNGNTGVSANDRDFRERRRIRHPHVRGDKGIGTTDIQSGDTAELGRIVDARRLQDFGGNGDGRIDRVGNNGQDGVGTKLRTTLHEGPDNARVRVEQIVPGHTGFAGDTGGDDNDVGARQGRLEALVAHGWPSAGVRQVTRHLGGCGDL